jgi:hypothetical protein
MDLTLEEKARNSLEEKHDQEKYDQENYDQEKHKLEKEKEETQNQQIFEQKINRIMHEKSIMVNDIKQTVKPKRKSILEIMKSIKGTPTENKNKWTSEEEDILIGFANKALYYKWLHFYSSEKYKKYYSYIMYCIVILSGVSGIVTFVFQSYPSNVIASSTIGGLNVLSFVLSLFIQLCEFSEYIQIHKSSYNSWDHFYGNVKEQINMNPQKRNNPNSILKGIQTEFLNIVETSPNIKKEIIARFKKTFHFEKNSVKEKSFRELENLNKKKHFKRYKTYFTNQLDLYREILNVQTSHYRKSWFKNRRHSGVSKSSIPSDLSQTSEENPMTIEIVINP